LFLIEKVLQASDNLPGECSYDISPIANQPDVRRCLTEQILQVADSQRQLTEIRESGFARWRRLEGARWYGLQRRRIKCAAGRPLWPRKRIFPVSFRVRLFKLPFKLIFELLRETV